MKDIRLAKPRIVSICFDGLNSEMSEFGIDLCVEQWRAKRSLVTEGNVGLGIWTNEDFKRLLSKSGKHQIVSNVGAHHLCRGQVRIITNDGIFHERTKNAVDNHGIRIQSCDIKKAVHESSDIKYFGKKVKCEVSSLNIRHEEELIDGTFIDDRNGEELNPRVVYKARMEEMKKFRQFGVYKKVRREIAMRDESC